MHLFWLVPDKYLNQGVLQQIKRWTVDLGDISKGKGDSLMKWDKSRAKDGTAGSCGRMGMRGFFLEHLHAEAPNLILWFVVLGYHVLIALTHVHTHIPALLLSKNDWLLLSVSFSLPLSVDYTYYGMSGKSAGNVIIRLALALGPLEPRRCHERGTERGVGSN